MSTVVKVFGKLVFESARELEEAAYRVDDEDEDEASREVQALIDEGVQTKRNEMHFAIHGEQLTADANLWFQDWLGDVAEAAKSGSLDTWQEPYGPKQFVRLRAGGEDEVVDESFPHK